MEHLYNLIAEAMDYVNDGIRLFENKQDIERNPHSWTPIYHRESDYDRHRLGLDVTPIDHIHNSDMVVYHELQKAKNHKDVDKIANAFDVKTNHGKKLYGWENGGTHIVGGIDPHRKSEAHPSRLQHYKDTVFSHMTGKDMGIMPHVHYSVATHK